jgi:hypothetical protein
MDLDVMAEQERRACLETDEQFAQQRAQHNAAIAKWDGRRNNAKLTLELRMALQTERLYVMALQGRVKHAMESDEQMRKMCNQKDQIIQLLIEHCNLRGVDLSDSMDAPMRKTH